MKTNNKKVRTLLEKYREISLLNKINSVLGWDLNVNLPYKAAEGRGEQSAYMAKIISEKWLDKDFRTLVEDINEKDLGVNEKAVLRNLRHAGKYYFRVPKEIIIEFAETTSKAFMVWQEAKAGNKFKDFEPYLVKIVKLNRMVAEHLGYKENPYDALLDIYEPGLTTLKTKKVFDEITPEINSLVKKTAAKDGDREKPIPQGTVFPEDDQRKLALFVLRKMNYDLDAGRMDVSSHPFTDTLGGSDIRITNRYQSDGFIESLMVAMHEGGHALYEQGVKKEYDGLPLEGGVSMGIHESQSRFWENQIGRSREFIKFLTPILQAFYPEQLSRLGTDTLFGMFNEVKPGLIRVESDEVTYNLHIALRFELEEALVNNRIKVKELPEIWREKMKEYLDVVPETDREGVLQDVHWSYGNMGYFPTYTLGNLYAAQFTYTMKKELNLEELTEKGELGTILSWLRGNIHQHGSLYLPDELAMKVTGEELNTRYFLEYLKNKYETTDKT